MRYGMICKILGILLMLFSFSMLTPVAVGRYYHDHDLASFVIAFGITIGIGFLLWVFNRKTKDELRTRDGFLVVFLMWTVLGVFGALPFMLSYSPHMGISQAVFESISGLTTTGATALKHIDVLPRSILYYRQQLQFLGGMGIIVLAVAILPMIGVGGMQLYKAETTGPMKDSKLTPRITETAKALWFIYVGLTVLCVLAYWACGMSLFDAICYAFSTISTGGYAPHDASIAYYPYFSVYVVSMIFMLLGGVNFSLHFLAFRRMQFKAYWRNAELRFYVYFLIGISVLVALILLVTGTEKAPLHAMVNALYQVISFSTTTGFVSDGNFMHWPLFLPIMLVLVGVVGACSGSTTGGIKIIRVMLFKQQITREINRLIHPNGTFPLKLGKQVVSDHVMSGVWAFLSAYVMIFIVFWLVLMATGLDPLSAFTALAACLSNAGPGLGKVVANYGGISDVARWVLTLSMLIGRLEVFTVLVLLSPVFWRR